MARDDDLWVLEPTMLFGIEDEEAPQQWQDAASFAHGLGEMVINDGFLTRL
jgi:hypothetical protein